MSDTPVLSKGEREELAKLIRARVRVAKADVAQRAAELVADVERQLASQYHSTHEAWADVTSVAKRAIQAADAEVAARCRALGIQEALRPSLYASWYERGENAEAARRVELRRVARSRIDAIAKKAVTAIERQAIETLTVLVRSALTSEEAKAVLAALPTPEQLMPALDVTELHDWAHPGHIAPHALEASDRLRASLTPAITAGEDEEDDEDEEA